MMSAPYNGKCLCGGIKFTLTANAKEVMTCFCEHCRKGAGGTSQVLASFPLQDLHIHQGKDLISTFVFTDTDSGRPKDKMFCKVCGVTLWTFPESFKEQNLVLVRTSLLDDGLSLKPDVVYYNRARPAWVSPIVGASQYD